eukprot:Seg1728.7 transcript_id=Seg1728.7/GoldUCD/mRNA.D3Y31 product="hypothetical protein" protein_id=Seg1728.7/GoldUCD/D3Y31
MNLLLLLAIWGCLTLQTESKKRKYGHPSHVNAAKRTKYNDEGLEPNLDMGTATTGPDDGDIISNYATENTPVFWRDVYEGRKKTHFKKTEEEGPPEGFELGADELPNTVGPSGNVYGGFPVNDMLGGFELPSPETLAILKAALKKYGPRNEYESHLHHDLENWAYGYEHHALPEYDVKETPPFYVTMLEGLKMAEENKKKPSCQQGAIPIQFEEGHATPEHVDKQVEDIKDEAKTAKDASKATQSDPPNAKLQSQLGLLGLLSKSASAKQEPQSRMDFTMPALNNSAAKDAADAKEVPSEVESTNVPVETSQPPNELKTEEKGDTGKQGSSFDEGKNVLDLSILPVPEAIQIGSLKSRHVPANNSDNTSSKSGNITEENKKEKTGAASKKVNKTAAKLSDEDKDYAVGGRDIRKGALLSTNKVAINNIGPVIASLGKELEQRLNQKFALANQGDTEFTIDVGINPDKNRRSKLGKRMKGKRLRKF